MTVYRNKQRGNVWMYEFVHRAQRYRDYCRDPETEKHVISKTEAKVIERAARAKAEADGPAADDGPPGGQYSLAEAQAALLKRVNEKRRKPKHIANIRLWGDDVLRHFGSQKPFAELTQKDVDGYVTAVCGETVKRWAGGKRSPTPDDYKNDELWRDAGRLRSKRQGNNYCKHLRKMLELAAKMKDPVTRRHVLDQDPPLEIELERVPKRKPRPMPDDELDARMVSLPPWRRDQAELSRLYGLRAAEGYRVELRHVEGSPKPVIFFRGEESKSGHDEYAQSGPDGWRLVNRLRRQAEKRGSTFLLTWPGAFEGVHWYSIWADGGEIPNAAWQPLKGPGSSWRKSAKRAGIAQPHRFHDVRARAITVVSQVDRSAAKGFARHQASATTDLYIGVADAEVAQAAATAMDRRPKAAAKPRFPIAR
ncbi:MAG: hypothetical protein WCI21_07130 [Alphaproteobacteria bacterium]